MKPFADMVFDHRSARGWAYPKADARMICLDPGETTGWAIFVGTVLRASGQLDTKSFPGCARVMKDFFYIQAGLGDHEYPFHVVMEDYKVYSWKSQSHSWSGVHTLRLIGAIQAILELQFSRHQVQGLTWQSAQQGKAFCTDPKLQAWGFYKEGERHARDAIRHGCNYLLFHNPEAK